MIDILFRTVMANGDYEKLQQGIFENYLEVPRLVANVFKIIKT